MGEGAKAQPSALCAIFGLKGLEAELKFQKNAPTKGGIFSPLEIFWVELSVR